MQVGPRDALACAESDQRLELLELAGDRVRLVAGAGQHVDREHADATGRAGHHDRTHRGRLAVLLHALCKLADVIEVISNLHMIVVDISAGADLIFVP